MLKKCNFILFSLLLISSSCIIAEDCCNNTSCLVENKNSDNESCAPCEDKKEVLVGATKVSFKVEMNGEEAAGEAFVVDGKGLTINGNGMLIGAHLICCEDNKLRIDAVLFTADTEGKTKEHGMISHDAGWGESKEFQWEGSTIAFSLMAIEKCMISIPEEVLNQA